jgi:hypothetical protein
MHYEHTARYKYKLVGASRRHVSRGTVATANEAASACPKKGLSPLSSSRQTLILYFLGARARSRNPVNTNEFAWECAHPVSDNHVTLIRVALPLITVIQVTPARRPDSESHGVNPIELSSTLASFSHRRK